MRAKTGNLTRSICFSLALFVGLMPLFMAYAHVFAQEHDAIQHRIEVSYKGFNGTPNLVIEARQGERIDLTFVWADEAVPDNAHRMYLKGYELKTSLLDTDNREATISFIADKTGEFELICDWRCEGHKEALQNGKVKISAGNGNGATFVATALSFESSAKEISGTAVTLTATLKSVDGHDIPEAPIKFFAETRFSGTEGLMEIGTSVTDSNGIATFEYIPTIEGRQKIIARFGGTGIYAESEAPVEIDVLAAVPGYVQDPASLEVLRGILPYGLWIVVAGVWVTFGYVLYQIIRIPDEHEGGSDM